MFDKNLLKCAIINNGKFSYIVWASDFDENVMEIVNEFRKQNSNYECLDEAIEILTPHIEAILSQIQTPYLTLRYIDELDALILATDYDEIDEKLYEKALSLVNWNEENVIVFTVKEFARDIAYSLLSNEPMSLAGLRDGFIEDWELPEIWKKIEEFHNYHIRPVKEEIEMELLKLIKEKINIDETKLIEVTFTQWFKAKDFFSS